MSEEQKNQDERSTFQVKGEELMKKVKELINEGNVRRIIIKNKEGHTYLEIPIVVGIIGVIIAPILAAIGAIAALAAEFNIEVVRKDDEG